MLVSWEKVQGGDSCVTGLGAECCLDTGGEGDRQVGATPLWADHCLSRWKALECELTTEWVPCGVGTHNLSVSMWAGVGVAVGFGR